MCVCVCVCVWRWKADDGGVGECGAMVITIMSYEPSISFHI